MCSLGPHQTSLRSRAGSAARPGFECRLVVTLPSPALSQGALGPWLPREEADHSGSPLGQQLPRGVWARQDLARSIHRHPGPGGVRPTDLSGVARRLSPEPQGWPGGRALLRGCSPCEVRFHLPLTCKETPHFFSGTDTSPSHIHCHSTSQVFTEGHARSSSESQEARCSSLGKGVPH